MPTQVLQVDTGAAFVPLALRPDVSGALVIACGADGPVGQRFVDRTAASRLTAADLVMPVDPCQALTPVHDEPVSIIVCTHERPDDLERCLAALLTVARPDDDILVVDNSPRRERTASVSARFGVRRVVEPRVGLNHARNAGLAAAHHDLVAFVDDDVVVTGFWRGNIAREFASPQVACVTGLVLPIELETKAQEHFESFSAHRRTFERRQFSRSAGLVPSRADVAGIGANMAFRRRVLVALGGFDTRLDAGTRTRAGGDTDMFARVVDAGHDIVFVPKAQVWHRHRRTMAELYRCVFGYGAGTFAMLTKRVMLGDLRAAETAARWVAGTTLKALRLRLTGEPAPPLRVNVAEWAGALCGPVLFALEAWAQGASARRRTGSR